MLQRVFLHNFFFQKKFSVLSEIPFYAFFLKRSCQVWKVLFSKSQKPPNLRLLLKKNQNLFNVKSELPPSIVSFLEMKKIVETPEVLKQKRLPARNKSEPHKVGSGGKQITQAHFLNIRRLPGGRVVRNICMACGIVDIDLVSADNVDAVPHSLNHSSINFVPFPPEKP